MAPPDERDGSNRDRDRDRHNDKQSPEQNPFVHFRRSVDNMAAAVFADLAEMFPSLQKHIPPPGTKFSETWNPEMFKRFNDSYERATNPERKQIERLPREAPDETQQGQHRRKWRLGGRRRNQSENQPEDKQPEHTSESEAIAAGIFSLLTPFEGLLFGSDNRISTPWKPTVEYLEESPYSPIQLERDTALSTDGDRWRLAFEDLLRVEHERPMLPLPPNWRPQRPSRVSYAWIGNLAQKGFVENQGTYPFLLEIFGLKGLDSWQVLQARYRNPSLGANFRVAEQAFFELPEFPSREQHEAVQEHARQLAQSTAQGAAETELDLYERWLRSVDEAISPMQRFPKAFGLADAEGDNEDESKSEGESRQFSSSSSKQTTFSSKGDKAEPAQEGEQGLGILSSLTTTERRVLPDGSVLTHTTLKKKFVDGREETDESTSIKKPDDKRAMPASEQVREQQPRQSTRRQRRLAEAAKEQQRQKKATQEREKKTDKENSGWFWSR